MASSVTPCSGFRGWAVCGGASCMERFCLRLLVQAFAPVLVMEAPDAVVPDRTARIVAPVPDTACRRPGHDGPAGELRSLVGADAQRGIAARLRCPVQQAHEALVAHTVDHHGVHALAAEVIDHSLALDAPARGHQPPHTSYRKSTAPATPPSRIPTPCQLIRQTGIFSSYQPIRH